MYVHICIYIYIMYLSLSLYIYIYVYIQGPRGRSAAASAAAPLITLKVSGVHKGRLSIRHRGYIFRHRVYYLGIILIVSGVHKGRLSKGGFSNEARFRFAHSKRNLMYYNCTRETHKLLNPPLLTPLCELPIVI